MISFHNAYEQAEATSKVVWEKEKREVLLSIGAEFREKKALVYQEKESLNVIFAQ